MDLGQAKERIRGIDEIHLEDRARWMVEVYQPSIGGMEIDYSMGKDVTSIENEERPRIVSLRFSVDRLWNESTACYVYGRFQACIILLATMLEAALELKLRLTHLWSEFESTCEERSRTLGRVIGFCDRKLGLPQDIVRKQCEVNKLRIDAVHLGAEKRTGDMFGNTPLDEVEYFKTMQELEGRPVKVDSKEGWISGDGVIFGLDFTRRCYVIVYRYKAGAREALEKSKQIITLL